MKANAPTSASCSVASCLHLVDRRLLYRGLKKESWWFWRMRPPNHARRGDCDAVFTTLRYLYSVFDFCVLRTRYSSQSGIDHLVLRSIDLSASHPLRSWLSKAIRVIPTTDHRRASLLPTLLQEVMRPSLKQLRFLVGSNCLFPLASSLSSFFICACFLLVAAA